MPSLLVTKRTEEIDHVETGKRMRASRVKKHVSLRTLADRIGVSAPYLSDLELGRRAWSEERAQQFIAALNAPSK